MENMENFGGTISNPKLSELRELERQNELEKKVNEVCEHIINTKDSYRKTGSLFHISVATVSDYCNRFAKLNPQRYQELKKVIDSNSEPTIKDENVKKRVLKNARLIVEGNTIEEITSITGVDYWVVYRDIKNRLKNIDSELYEQVNSILKAHRNANLNRGNKK